MGTLPELDPGDYAIPHLERMNLVRLSQSYEATQSYLVLCEQSHRSLRARIAALAPGQAAGDLRADLDSSIVRVGLIRRIARDVRLAFSRRLREENEALGFLVDRMVYRATVDKQGIEAIELANPPSRERTDV